MVSNFNLIIQTLIISLRYVQFAIIIIVVGAAYVMEVGYTSANMIRILPVMSMGSLFRPCN